MYHVCITPRPKHSTHLSLVWILLYISDVAIHCVCYQSIETITSTKAVPMECITLPSACLGYLLTNLVSNSSYSKLFARIIYMFDLSIKLPEFNIKSA